MSLTFQVKSFSTRSEAEAFVSGREPNSGPSAPVGEARFYGVASGHNPGVYTDWATAQEQIKGWKLPKYKRFSTRGEAEAFVQAGGRGGKVESSTTELIDEDEQLGEFDDEVSDVESFAVPSKKRKTSPAASIGLIKTSQTPVQIAATTSAAKSRASDSKSKPLSIYTDGSSLANGKVGAVAGVGVFFGDGDDRWVSTCCLEQYIENDTDLAPLGTFPRHWRVNFKQTKGQNSQLSYVRLRLHLCTVKFTSTQTATTA